MGDVTDLLRLRKKHTMLSGAVIVVAVVIIFLLSYYLGNGFSIADPLWGTNSDCSINLIQPGENEIFYKTDDITISGDVWGGIPKKVIIWDAELNVPIYATITGTSFGVSAYAGDLSDGVHTLGVQAQTVDGRWTPVIYRTIEIRNYQGGTSSSYNTDVTQTGGGPLGSFGVIFRPVGEVLAQTVVYITGGTASDDLNGDNIPDPLQQSPVTPRYNPTGSPLTLIIVYGLIILVVIIVILYVVKPYLERKQRLKREMVKSPETRYWLLRLKSLQNKELRKQLARERAERKQIVEKIKHDQKKKPSTSKRPVKIFLTPKKDGSQPSPGTINKIKKRIQWR